MVEKRTTIQFEIDLELRKTLQHYALDQEKTVSEILREYIEKLLKDYKK